MFKYCEHFDCFCKTLLRLNLKWSSSPQWKFSSESRTDINVTVNFKTVEEMDSFDSRISGCPFTFLLWGIFVMFGFCAQYYLSTRKPDDWLVQACKNRKERSAAKILFVIAHPDDECMFFGPAITSLTKPNEKKNLERKNIFLLCLSDGTDCCECSFFIEKQINLILFRKCWRPWRSKEARAHSKL